MAKYHLSYEATDGRCAWCWERLPAAEPHAVVSASRPPHLVLHFHNPCWDAYRAVSGVDLGPVGSSDGWTPERLETLRIGSGMSRRAFCGQLGITEGTYARILAGDAAAFGPGVRNRVRRFAAVARFDSQSPIDWSDRRAVFCLRMHCGLKPSEFARLIGASVQQLPIWERGGVPVRSVRTWGRLAALARKRGFDASSVVDDRLWTTDHVKAAIKASGRSNRVWAVAAGCSQQAIQQWRAGSRPIHREAAWKLSRAAQDLGVELPPPGLVGYRKGAWSVKRTPSEEQESKRLEALREAKWDIETLRLLGTRPDRVLAAAIGKSRNSVATMRRALEIPVIDARTWDGQVQPQVLSDDELSRRWGLAKATFLDVARKRRREP